MVSTRVAKVNSPRSGWVTGRVWAAGPTVRISETF
jgi:hypothetical protein